MVPPIMNYQHMKPWVRQFPHEFPSSMVPPIGSPRHRSLVPTSVPLIIGRTSFRATNHRFPHRFLLRIESFIGSPIGSPPKPLFGTPPRFEHMREQFGTQARRNARRD